MKIRAALSSLILVAGWGSLALSCSSDSTGSKVNDAAAGAGASGPDARGGATGSAASGSGIASTDLQVTPGGRSGTVGGDGTPEVCDGVDNDHNGVIDDVDANGDGVCDCLLVATLGVKGGAGQGDVFATWLTARSNNGAASLGDQVLTPELLAKYQVIVTQDVHQNHLYSAAEVMALSDWVNNGGGLMTMTGYSQAATEVLNVNTLLAPFSMSYGDQHILPKRGGSTVPITMWIPHPIDMGVMAVGIDNGYAVLGMGTAIATGGGYDVGKVEDVGKGHVFVWGDEWVTYNSEWTQHADYQVQLFWLNTIKWLTVAGECQVAIPPNPPK